MNREEQYYKSVDILLDAYNKGELEHQDCSKCAVGNILGHGDWSASFSVGFYLDLPGNVQDVLQGRRSAWDDTWVNNSEYSITELARIEYAFEYETSCKLLGKSVDLLDKIRALPNEQYEGLCRVLDCLKEIHEVDQPIIDDHKEQFKTIYKEKYLVSAG